MSVPKTSDRPDSTAATQFKIVADDAAKAVRTIKEKFGEAAKVVSVKQQPMSGITGFMKKPRLEIIVEVPASPAASSVRVAVPKGSEEAPPAGKLESISSDENSPKPDAVERRKPITHLYSKTTEEVSSDGYFSNLSEDLNADRSSKLGSAANPVRRGTLEYVERAVSMLRSVGFDDLMIERIRYELDFKKLGEIPTMEIYSRICDWLRKQFPASKPTLSGDCRAFIGANGVGKTSAMSKSLSAEVFVNGREPVVLKVDGSVPNSSDGLEAFCEIMGAPLYRSLDEIEERSKERPIYVDMPGLNVANADAVQDACEILDEVAADERVLVVNAAYEAEMIAETMLAGSRMGATHVVFTHLDETRRAGKLWKFVLGKAPLPLFFSHGPNPAGDYTMDPFSYLLEKTFPQGRELASARRKAPMGQSVESSINKEMASA